MWKGDFNGRDLLYPSIYIRKLGKRLIFVGAHRVSYELFVGTIPRGYTIDHLCRNTHRVNPYHLEPVTPEENNLRGTSASAQNARKTHCKYGHSLAQGNYYLRKGGSRLCKECVRRKNREAAQRRRTLLRTTEVAPQKE